MSGVTQGSFLDNKAAFAGGAIYADSASTAHLASEYNHTQAQSLFGNCFVTFGNELQPVVSNKVSVFQVNLTQKIYAIIILALPSSPPSLSFPLSLLPPSPSFPPSLPPFSLSPLRL